MSDLPAYSTDTDTDYASWDDLVAAEANGYVVVGLSTRPNTAPIVVGPFATKAEADRARARLFRKWKIEEAKYHSGDWKVSSSVRVLWKDNRKK